MRDISWNKLEGKTVLITGAYGMLASYMLFMLVYLNESKEMDIKIIVLAKSKEKLEKRIGKLEKYKYISFYASSLESEVCINEDIDYIIHAASLASPDYYGICPVQVLLPNTIGTYLMLQLATDKHAEGFLFFSTGDIYGVVNGKERIMEEDYGYLDPLDIHNCYSESKRMAETMCKAWNYQYNVQTKIVRIWHTYSPTMNINKDPRVFSSFVNNIVHKNDITIHSSGKAKRSFCYIADAVAAFFTVLFKGENAEPYNVCNSTEFYSISELALHLVNLYPEWGLNVKYIKRNQDEPYVENSVANLVPPDNRKLIQLGWHPQYDIDKGFKRVVRHFMEIKV